MLQELNEIRRMRKRLGIGQKELAAAAGVSQSLIAKIERGKTEPTYSKVKRIFEILEELGKKEEIKAKELMNKKVIFAKAKEKVKEIIKVMKQKGISQMPVLEKGKVCGLVSEKTILDRLAKGEKVSEMKAEEVMEDCPPTVSLETSRKAVLELLKENQIVLVGEKGNMRGIISKSDVLGAI